MSDKPGYLRNLAVISDDSIAVIDRFYRRMLESLMAVDDMVAAVRTALDSAGLLDDTYIFFTSDNGFHLGEHRILMVKGTHFTESARVPLLVRGPGVVAGRTETRLALNNDLAPTFAAIAGITPPDYVDGRSLVPLLRGEAVAWRQSFLIETYAKGAAESVMRTGDFFYRVGEYYDLVADPYQLDNRAATLTDVQKAELLGPLTALRQCAGASCRAAEDQPVLRPTR